MAGLTDYLKNHATERMDVDGKVYVKVYNNSGGALTNGAIKCVVPMWITALGAILVPIAVASNATASNIIGIVDNSVENQDNIAIASYGWVQIEGIYGDAVGGTTMDPVTAFGATTTGTIAANDQLKVTNGAPTVFTAVSTGATVGGGVQNVLTSAIAVANVSTNLWSVYLTGLPCSVA